MKKLLSLAILAAAFLISCSTDPVIETQAREEPKGIDMVADWDLIEHEVLTYVNYQSNGSPYYLSVYCWTEGINYGFVNDNLGNIFQVTYLGGVSYSVKKVTAYFADHECDMHEASRSDSEESIKGNETPEDVIAMDKLLDFVELAYPEEARGTVICHSPYYATLGWAYVKVGTRFFHVTWTGFNTGTTIIKTYFVDEVSEPNC